jgi:molybdate transport system substrate-binding protein
MTRRSITAATVGVAFVLAAAVSAGAAEFKVMGSNALKSTIEELKPAFEKSTGHKVTIQWGAAVPLKSEIEKGASFDLSISTIAAIDDLIKQGRLAGATRTILVNSGAGVAVRKGAAKPDISTVDAFKRALVTARSVAYVEQGGTGIYLKALLPRLGLAEALKGKIVLLPPENPAAHAVANGEAEIGMTQISEILPYAGAELVGPLPAEIQLTTSFGAAVASNTKEAAAAQSLINFLKSPVAAAVLKAKGLDPVM